MGNETYRLDGVDVGDGLLNGSGHNAGGGTGTLSVGHGDSSGGQVGGPLSSSRLRSSTRSCGGSAQGNRNGRADRARGDNRGGNTRRNTRGVRDTGGSDTRGSTRGRNDRRVGGLQRSSGNSAKDSGERARGSSAVDSTSVVQVAGVQAMNLSISESSEGRDKRDGDHVSERHFS